MFAFSSGCMKCNEEESNLFFLRTQMAIRVIERTKDEFRQIRTNSSRSIHDSYNIFPPSTSGRIPNRSPTDRNRDSRPRFPNIPHTATVYTHVETEFKRSIWSVIRDQRLVISRRLPLPLHSMEKKRRNYRYEIRNYSSTAQICFDGSSAQPTPR